MSDGDATIEIADDAPAGARTRVVRLALRESPPGAKRHRSERFRAIRSIRFAPPPASHRVRAPALPPSRGPS
eukprot:31167-Pelagococcus_subviridis.AAC.8